LPSRHHFTRLFAADFDGATSMPATSRGREGCRASKDCVDEARRPGFPFRIGCFYHIDQREVPELRQVEALIDLPLIAGAVAEIGAADMLAAVFVGERARPVPSGTIAPTMQ